MLSLLLILVATVCLAFAAYKANQNDMRLAALLTISGAATLLLLIIFSSVKP